MDNYNFVRPEHLNHHGSLFGGQLLLWVDEFAWMAAAKDFPGYSFVTRAMDKIEFKNPVRSGSILRFHAEVSSKGTSSVTYLVQVYEDAKICGKEILTFSTSVTFVSIDDNGNKKNIESND